MQQKMEICSHQKVLIDRITVLKEQRKNTTDLKDRIKITKDISWITKELKSLNKLNIQRKLTKSLTNCQLCLDVHKR